VNSRTGKRTASTLFGHVRQWARTLKLNVLALYLAARDPRVPWYAKAVAACVAVYAISPIDLIPDVIPILGYLDDVVLVPLGIGVAMGGARPCHQRASA
jgi:uncharacterized membrane protein YkvA (DUF1232 family)